MKIAYISVGNPHNRYTWSGTFYKMFESLKQQNHSVEWIPVYNNGLGKFEEFSIKCFGKLIHKPVMPLFFKCVAKQYAKSIPVDKLNTYDLIYAPCCGPYLYHLKGIKKPIVYMSDASPEALFNYYVFNTLKCNRDQANSMEKKALDKCLFPLGDIDKPRVRELAEELNLSIAKKKDSTGICFIGERDFRKFLSNYIPMKPGKIIDIDTLEEIGDHNGVYYYTVGQRKGFGVGGNRGPYFCVGKNIEHNLLYLTSIKNEHYLYSDSAYISGINWINDLPAEASEIGCKFRYRQPDNKVTIKKVSDTEAMLHYPQKIKAVAPGQEAVFYLNDEMLGGGTIDKVFINGQDVNEYLDSLVFKK